MGLLFLGLDRDDSLQATAGHIGHKRKKGRAFITVTGDIGDVGHNQLSELGWSELRFRIDQVWVALEAVPRVSRHEDGIGVCAASSYTYASARKSDFVLKQREFDLRNSKERGM